MSADARDTCGECDRIIATPCHIIVSRIGATRHFRTLYTIAAHPGGPAQGIGGLRPPLYGKRRDRMLRQAQGWGAQKLQNALTILTDTDLQLRSAGQSAPAQALTERAMIRLAMLARSR